MSFHVVKYATEMWIDITSGEQSGAVIYTCKQRSEEDIVLERIDRDEEYMIRYNKYGVTVLSKEEAESI